MNGGVYFEGDPATDSARRHMERVLKGREQPRRWPWILAGLGSFGLWFVWRSGREAAKEQADEVAGRPREAANSEAGPRPGDPSRK